MDGVSDLATPGAKIVTTGGGVILDNTDDITIPDNITLTCGGTSVVAGIGNNDYRISALSKAIVLDPTQTNEAGQFPVKGFTVRLKGKNSTFEHCTEVAGGGIPVSDVYPNPYSPSIWFPGCDPAGTPTDCASVSSGATTKLRSSVLEASAFNPNQTAAYNVANGTCSDAGPPVHCGPASQSVGITVDGANHATIRDVAILGFGTCAQVGVDYSDHFTSPPGTIIEHVQGDCNTGGLIKHSNAPLLTDVRMNPLLTAADYVARKILSAAPSGGSGSAYRLKVSTTAVDDPDSSYLIRNGDTVWIGTGDGGGAEAARGRWIVSCTNGPDGNCTCDSGSSCQSFTLTGSQTTIAPIGGNVSNAFNNGTPPTAITGIALGDTLKSIEPGQQVVDSGGCITAASGTTVTAVWPARGIVYISKPPSCSVMGDSLTFTNNPLNGADCSHDIVTGNCVIVDVGFRFGDGFDIHDTGGATCYNCRSVEHMVPFHMNTGSNNAHLVNSITELNVDLPDQNLWAMNLHGGGSCSSLTDDDYDRQNIVTLLIDGVHCTDAPVPPPSATLDACDVEIVDSVLGQHRPVGMVVNTQCSNQNRMTNIGLGVDNTQDNGIGFELDDGVVALSNTGGSAANSFVSDVASLAISNVLLDKQTLYVQSAVAAGNISGCGNKFKAPTPYLCAPSSFTQLPGGRLTLVQGQPVMTADTTATHVYYAPYLSQQVPLYNPLSGVFGLVDITPAGLSLSLAATGTYTAFDVFAGMDGNALKLCSNPWNNSTSRQSTGGVTPVNGVWVNQNDIGNCFHDTGDMFDCAPQTCTYLGTFYVGAAAGHVSQQFGPVSGSGGGAPCLCLYNAYNHVNITSASVDSGGTYTYGLTAWEYMRNSASNAVLVLDGLGQMQRAASVSDAIKNGTSTGGAQIVGGIGVEFLPAGGTAVAPIPIVQANTATTGTYSSSITAPPALGLWTAQGVEAVISGSGANPTFGGNGYQQVVVQVAD